MKKLTLDPAKPKAFLFRLDGQFGGVLFSNGKLVARINHVNCSESSGLRVYRSGLRSFSDWKIYIHHCFRSNVKPDIADPQGQLSVMLGPVSQLSTSQVRTFRERLANIKKFTKYDKRRLFNHGKEKS